MTIEKVFVLNTTDEWFETPTIGVYTSQELAQKALELFKECVSDNIIITELELDSLESQYPSQIFSVEN